MPPTLSDVMAWARQAGEILRAGIGQDLQVEHKGLTDLVTKIDKCSEAYLVEQIRSHFNNQRIVTEESGLLPGQEDHCWYIDPLDGTTNYVHGVPFFSVSVAYAHQGQLQLAVVYDPTRDECFYAERGQGAWLNGKPLHVANNSELIQALLATGFPYNMNVPDNNMEYYSRFVTRSQAVRRLGSAALELCYVGAGRLDGYWESGIKSYDFAAGALIAREAGGVVTDYLGDPDILTPPYQVVAANPTLQPQLLAVIQEDPVLLGRP